MAIHFPIVVEREDSGVFSAYVIGLPVYAQGVTLATVKRAIGHVLAAYLDANPETRPSAATAVPDDASSR